MKIKDKSSSNDSEHNTSSFSNTLGSPLTSSSNDSKHNTSSFNNTLGSRQLRALRREILWRRCDHGRWISCFVEGQQAELCHFVCDGVGTVRSVSNDLAARTRWGFVDELCGERIKRTLRVDNTSAVAMLTGGAGSWRTRHLKVRSAYRRKQVACGALDVEHVERALQLADLATKLHPQARLLELLRLWNFEGASLRHGETEQLKVACLLCLVMALLAQPAGTTRETDPEPATRLQITGLDEITLVMLLVCIAAIALWEAAKAVWRFFVPDYEKQGFVSYRSWQLRQREQSWNAWLQMWAQSRMGHLWRAMAMVDLRIRLRQRPQGWRRQQRPLDQAKLQDWRLARWMKLCWPPRLHYRETQNEHELAKTC